MFEPKSFIVLISLSACFFFSLWISIFVSWLTIVVQLVYAYFVFYCLFKFSYLPFHQESSAIMSHSVCYIMITFDFLYVILYFFPSASGFSVLGVFVISVIVFPISMRLYVGSKCKTISHRLHGNNLNDEGKIQWFSDLGLDLNENKAFMYLRIGFSHICDLFLYWSLLRFIVASHQSTHAQMSCLQILSFFPGESRQLNSLFFKVTRAHDLTFSGWFLISQVYKIKTLR